MDEVIFEEFKGTGNSEIVLDRKLADRRTYPAIDINRSATRREELLCPRRAQPHVHPAQGARAAEPVDSMEFLLEKVKISDTNEEFLASMNS
jgi:transcription termination factor Rho